MNWLRLELRLLRTDLRVLAAILTSLLLLVFCLPDLARDLAGPALLLYLALLVQGALRHEEVRRAMGVFAGPGPTDPRQFALARGLSWLGFSLALSVVFAVFLTRPLHESGVGPALVLFLLATLCSFPSAREGKKDPRSWAVWLLVGTYVLAQAATWGSEASPAWLGMIDTTQGPNLPVVVGVSATYLISVVIRWLRGRPSVAEIPPRPSPKPVRPKRWHLPRIVRRTADPLGTGPRARKEGRSPRSTRAIFLDPLAAGMADARTDEGGGGEWIRRIFFEMAAGLYLLIAIPSPGSEGLPIGGLLLGIYGFGAAAAALRGERALVGWPLPPFAVWGIVLARPTFWLAIGVVIAALPIRNATTKIAHRSSLVVPEKIGQRVARWPGRPAALPTPPPYSRHPDYVTTRLSDFWSMLFDVSVDDNDTISRRRISILSIQDGRRYFGEVLAFYLRSRFGIVRDPSKLETYLGKGVDLDSFLAVLKGTPKREISPEDRAGWAARWHAERGDILVIAFRPALRKLEADIQPAIRRSRWTLLAFHLLLGLFALLLGARAALARPGHRAALLATAAMVPASWSLIRWEPVGLDGVAFLVSHPWVGLGGLLAILALLARHVVRTGRRRVLEPAG